MLGVVSKDYKHPDNIGREESNCLEYLTSKYVLSISKQVSSPVCNGWI